VPVVEQVEKCYTISRMHSKFGAQGDLQKLEDLGEVLNQLDAGDSIVVASAFSHMLSLGNLAQEVQSAFRRRIKQAKKGDIGDESSSLTESNLEETFRRLVNQLGKTPTDIFEALKSQTVDLVLTAHPTQSVRRALLQKHTRCGIIMSLRMPGISFFD
jgi:phosphoenolpyruvate carboxylase